VALRFPDKPTPASEARLLRLRDGEWLCQVKFDGWRAHIGWDGEAPTLLTRRFNPIPAGEALRRQLLRFCRKLPRNTLLDAEWVPAEGSPVFEDRPSAGPERLVLFDALAAGGIWLGDLPASERFDALVAVAAPARRRLASVEIVECVRGGYADLYRRARAMPGAEGVVLKRCTSPFLGARDGCTANPHWLKVKWKRAA
jgi:ATP-dependent DNA ligase